MDRLPETDFQSTCVISLSQNFSRNGSRRYYSTARIISTVLMFSYNMVNLDVSYHIDCLCSRTVYRCLFIYLLIYCSLDDDDDNDDIRVFYGL